MVLLILLLQYWFSIAVDSNPVGADRTYRALYWMKNPAPGIFKNVAVYAGDPWHTAAQGIIKDIKYATQSCKKWQAQQACLRNQNEEIEEP